MFTDRFAVAGPTAHCQGRLHRLFELGPDRVVNVPGSRETDPELLTVGSELFAHQVLPQLRTSWANRRRRRGTSAFSRGRREEQLAQMTAIAKASQVALLPPLPPEITGISIAARYRSAAPGASVGGDLYEIIPAGHGIRVIIGDVRGKGLEAILLARHVLSAFRRSAVAVPALEHVAGEVSRAIRPHLGEEDFVTAVLAQIAPGGELTIVNCGHHPPLLHHGGGLRPLTGTTATLPLGLEDDFTAFTASWLPGDRLLLYTDGLVESRNHHGDFLPEDQIATALLAADCDQALDTLLTAVHRHTGGHGHDDMALLLLEHGTYPRSSAGGRPATAQADDAQSSGIKQAHALAQAGPLDR